MLIGDRSALAFDIGPVTPTWERRSASDRGPWGRLSIVANGHSLTRALEVDRDRVVPGVHVPLLPVADWLVQNIRAIAYEEAPSIFRGDVRLHRLLEDWDRAEPWSNIEEDDWDDARYEWYTRHFLLSGAEGAMLPDLGLVRADGKLWISWKRTRYEGGRALEYLVEREGDEGPGVEAVDWQASVDALSDFVIYVAQNARSIDGTPAWVHHEDPLRHALEIDASEYLRLVAPSAGSWLFDLDIDPQSDPAESIALQALRDVDLTSGPDGSLTEALRFLETSTGGRAAEPLSEARERMRGSSSRSDVEDEGYQAAVALRDAWDLNGQPLSSDDLVSRLESTLGSQLVPYDGSAGRNSMVVGARDRGIGKVVVFENPRTRREWVRRMEIARAVGHLLLDPMTDKGVLGAASSWSASGPRRRRSGAFAAELLLPADGVRRYLGARDLRDPDVFSSIMGEFGVGVTTAANHLWNRHLLAKADRDRLMEDHAYAA